jgi:hypothetical protein
MNARILIVPLLVSVAACAMDQDTSEVAQLGARVVSASNTRVEAAPLDWSTVDARIAELGLDSIHSVLKFVPDEGLYALAQKLVRVDECGIGEGSAEVDHLIQKADARAATYDDALVVRGEEEAALSVGCELSDHTYRCNSSTTKIDFSVLGLAAKVTIQNDSFGLWSGQSAAFIGAFPFTVSCEGRDCDKAPASNLFGTLSKPMPCLGIEVAAFKK